MGVKIDDAIARKKTMRTKGDSPDSIDLTAEEALKSPKDVLALGRVIVCCFPRSTNTGFPVYS